VPSNTFPSSTLTLTSLQDPQTPSLLDIRPYLQTVRDPATQQIAILIQQAFDQIQETLRSASPTLQYLSIASADIADLTVSGQFGPGAFQVLNGPPNYDQIGWIGSQAKSTAVNLTSIVAGLVTAAAAHGLKPGDNVFIESTTDINNTGYYVVATTPTTTTFTVTGGVAGGNSTGGDMVKQFQGEWIKAFAAGGTAFDNAPFQVDVDGSVNISGPHVKIVIVQPGVVTTTVTIDPAGEGISITDDSSISAITSLTARQVDTRATAGGDLSESSLGAGAGFSFLDLKDIAAQVRLSYSTSAGQLVLLDSSGYPVVQLDDAAGILVYGPLGVPVSAIHQDGHIGAGVTNPLYAIDALGDVNASGVHRVAGTKVVGARGASVSIVSGIAGATYTATEQGILNNAVTAINAINARLNSTTGHGLIT
jgi:hypothetical protein